MAHQIAVEVALVKAFRSARLTGDAEVPCEGHGVRPTAPLCWPQQRVAVYAKACQHYGCKFHYRGESRLSRRRVANRKRQFAAALRVLRSQGFRIVVWWEHQEVSRAVEQVSEHLRSRRRRAA